MLVLDRLKAFGARKLEAIESAFAQGFVCGDFAVAGGHFEALGKRTFDGLDFARPRRFKSS